LENFHKISNACDRQITSASTHILVVDTEALLQMCIGQKYIVIKAKDNLPLHFRLTLLHAWAVSWYQILPYQTNANTMG